MKNLLFISTYPFPLDMGSKQHAYYFLKALCSHYNVCCIFFILPGQSTPLNIKEDLIGLDVKAYEICYFKTPANRNRYARLLIDIISFPNIFMNLATHDKGLQTINSFIDKYAIDIIHFEHFWFAKYALSIRSSIKQVVVYHDLHHDIFRQLARLEKKYHRKLLHMLSCIKFYIFEKLLEKRATLKIFLNPKEMISFPKKAIHLPHVANSDIRYKPARVTDFFNILFIGAYNHPPNRRSVEFIIHRVLPLLTQMPYHFRLHIIGAGTEKIQNLLDNNIYREHVFIHGFEKSINLAFEDMDIALFPIFSGGGIKTKIIDALAAGVPVVTTQKGLYGLNNLPNDCINVGNTSEELANEIVKLMQSYTQRRERSEKGRIFIEKVHSFDALKKKLNQCYSNL